MVGRMARGLRRRRRYIHGRQVQLGLVRVGILGLCAKKCGFMYTNEYLIYARAALLVLLYDNVSCCECHWDCMC